MQAIKKRFRYALIASRKETRQKKRDNDTANKKPFPGVERNENTTIDGATLLEDFV